MAGLSMDGHIYCNVTRFIKKLQVYAVRTWASEAPNHWPHDLLIIHEMCCIRFNWVFEL